MAKARRERLTNATLSKPNRCSAPPSCSMPIWGPLLPPSTRPKNNGTSRVLLYTLATLMPKVESYKAKADRIRAYAIDSGFSSLLAGLLVEKFFLKHQDRSEERRVGKEWRTRR